ncbi:MAG: PAS domain-containing protein [Candidatus Methanomethylophilaceae archaeon]|nr:PAS domain-containing protein [Candidatus Methanomethylophilaceae archaeon]
MEDGREAYTEKLLNMIMDIVDDIVIVHDSEHTVIWINRAGEKAFNTTMDEVYGTKCYALFNHSTPCSDCNAVSHGGPTNFVLKRKIPGSDIEYSCSSSPFYENGQLKFVVQHLTPVVNRPIVPTNDYI